MPPKKIIDMHTHIFPDVLARKAMITLAERSRLPFFSDGSEEGLVRSMEKAGVTHAVICNIAVKAGQSANVLRFAAQTRDRYQDDTLPRLIPFGSVHPLEPEWKALLGEVKRLGLAGIKLHPDYQGFYINDPAMEPFYKEAIRLGLVMLFHAGVDAGYPAPVHADTARILDVLPVLERGKTVLAHMGGYKMEREVVEKLCGSGVYFDTSYSLDKMDVETAREIVRRHGSGHIVYGTDSPWADQEKYMVHFENVFAKGFLPEADLERILWLNAAGLLGLSE